YCKYQREGKRLKTSPHRISARGRARFSQFAPRRHSSNTSLLISKMESDSPPGDGEVEAESEAIAGFSGLEVLDAVAEELLLEKLFDKDNLGGHEDGRLAGLVGHRDFDQRLQIVLLAALEAQAPFGHVLTEDHVITLLGMAHASRVRDFHARVLAALGGGKSGFFRRRQSNDGTAR